jgi:hypothetical protein
VARYDTMTSIWSSAAIQLGLVNAAVANPYAATNSDHLLLNELINEVGLELLDEHDWPDLIKEGTIATSNGDYQYDLPTSFDRLVADTAWNRTGDRPLCPIGGRGWQYFQAVTGAGTPEYWIRRINNEWQVYPTPEATSQTFAYEYVSRYWARATASSAPDKESCTVATDVIHYDRRLFVAALRRKYRRSKGFNSDADEQDYQDALSVAKGKADVPRVIDMCPSPLTPGIGLRNWPLTGYGSE